MTSSAGSARCCVARLTDCYSGRYPVFAPNKPEALPAAFNSMALVRIRLLRWCRRNTVIARTDATADKSGVERLRGRWPGRAAVQRPVPAALRQAGSHLQRQALGLPRQPDRCDRRPTSVRGRRRGSQHPDRPPVSPDERVGRQQDHAFDEGLRNQHAVERVLVDGLQIDDRSRMPTRARS